MPLPYGVTAPRQPSTMPLTGMGVYGPSTTNPLAGLLPTVTPVNPTIPSPWTPPAGGGGSGYQPYTGSGAGAGYGSGAPAAPIWSPPPGWIEDPEYPDWYYNPADPPDPDDPDDLSRWMRAGDPAGSWSTPVAGSGFGGAQPFNPSDPSHTYGLIGPTGTVTGPGTTYNNPNPYGGSYAVPNPTTGGGAGAGGAGAGGGSATMPRTQAELDAYNYQVAQLAAQARRDAENVRQFQVEQQRLRDKMAADAANGRAPNPADQAELARLAQQLALAQSNAAESRRQFDAAQALQSTQFNTTAANTTAYQNATLAQREREFEYTKDKDRKSMLMSILTSLIEMTGVVPPPQFLAQLLQGFGFNPPGAPPAGPAAAPFNGASPAPAAVPFNGASPGPGAGGGNGAAGPGAGNGIFSGLFPQPQGARNMFGLTPATQANMAPGIAWLLTQPGGLHGVEV